MTNQENILPEFSIVMTVTHIETNTRLSVVKRVRAETWKQAVKVAIREAKILNSELPHD